MSMALVQSALGSNASGTFTSGAGGVTSCTGTFGSTTTLGNLLVVVCYHNQHVTSGFGLSGAISSVATPGVTWSASLLTNGFDASPNRQGVTIFACGNCPSIAAGTLTTFTLTNTVSSVNGSEIIEFALYEFSGVSNVFTNYNNGQGLVNTKAGTSSGVSSVPNAGNVTTNKVCLIVSAMKGDTRNTSPGAGFIAGQTMIAATFGQFQYQTDVAAGVNATAFSALTENNWGSGAVAFQAPTVTSVGVTFGDLFGF